METDVLVSIAADVWISVQGEKPSWEAQVVLQGGHDVWLMYCDVNPVQ